MTGGAGSRRCRARTDADRPAFPLEGDNVGTVYNASPDGQADGHFTLALDTGGGAKTLTSIELNSTTGGVWDTVFQGSWAVLGVIRNGKRLNPKDESFTDAVSGKAIYELYAGDYGYFQAAHTFVAKVTFSDGTSVTSGKEGAGPGQESTTLTPTAAPTPTPKPKLPQLDGAFAVKQTVLAGTNLFDRKVGDVFDRSWSFRSKCLTPKVGCIVILSRQASSGATATVALKFNGSVYVGTESFVGPYTCGGQLFLYGEKGPIQWIVGVTQSKTISGQLRATAFSGKGLSRFSPTADVVAMHCGAKPVSETDRLSATRK